MDISRHLKLHKDFFPQAAELRQFFDSQFKNPEEIRGERFVWDYWHIPNEYTLVRTPAEHYFPQDLYTSLTTALTEFGQKHLGCHELTAPWLSYYVEGCEQQMHQDNPHGPWAYVYSLTDWETKEFSGGETFLMQSDRKTLLHEVEPHFNQLCVFDPRIPHGVRKVTGTNNPQKARLVIHGWFTTPAPYIDGPLDPENVEDVLSEKLNPIFDEIDEMGSYMGTLSFLLNIDQAGKVTQVHQLSNTLNTTTSHSLNPDELALHLEKKLGEMGFQPATGPSRLTLPFLFE